MNSKNESNDDVLRKLELIALEEARSDLLAFTLYRNPEYLVNWHHGKLAAKLTAFAKGEIQFLMVFMPPRHGKSELVSRNLPPFLHGLYPDAEIMAASYSDSLASDMCRDVQSIMDSHIYQQIFPHVKIPPPGGLYTKGIRNTEEHHVLGRKGKYRGQGVGGSFTGKGANFIIIDDPIKGREAADSEAFREKLWNFFNNDLFSRLETDLKTGRKGQILITQTRWHEDDLSGRLLELMKKDPDAIQWEILDYPAIKVSNDDPSDPRKVGDPLWPEKYDTAALTKIKSTGGPRAWASLYQQNPVPAGGALFKDSMFKFGDMPEEFEYTFITSDTAYKDKQESDFTVLTAWGVVEEQPYIRDVWMEQIKAAEVEGAVAPFIKRYATEWGSRGIWIEPKGHGIYLNQKYQKDGVLVPSDDDLDKFFKDRNKDKVTRANNAVPHLANRYIVINNALANKEDLVAQCLGFPKVKHDDFVDTVIDGVKFIYGRQVGILDVL